MDRPRARTVAKRWMNAREEREKNKQKQKKRNTALGTHVQLRLKYDKEGVNITNAARKIQSKVREFLKNPKLYKDRRAKALEKELKNLMENFLKPLKRDRSINRNREGNIPMGNIPVGNNTRGGKRRK
jgi:hypothetical protein